MSKAHHCPTWEDPDGCQCSAPHPRPVVPDLAGALRESVDAARARRLGRPVVDREAVVDAVQVSMCGTVNRDNMMERANCEEIADAVLALLPTEEGEGS